MSELSLFSHNGCGDTYFLLEATIDKTISAMTEEKAVFYSKRTIQNPDHSLLLVARDAVAILQPKGMHIPLMAENAKQGISLFV